MDADIAFAAAAAGVLLLAVGSASGADDHLEAGAGRGHPGPGRELTRSRADDRGLQLREHPARRGSTPTSSRMRSTSPPRRRASSSPTRASRIASASSTSTARATRRSRCSSASSPRRRHREARRHRACVEPGLAHPRGPSSNTARRSRPGAQACRTRAPTRPRSSPSRPRRNSRSSRDRRANQLLASVKDEIAEMQAEEQRRQAALAEQARLAHRPHSSRAQAAAQETYDTPVVEDAVLRPEPPGTRGTAASWGSRSSTSASRTSGAARARRPASTARVSSSTSSRRSAFTSRTTLRRSTAMGLRCRTTSSQPGDLVFFSGLGHVGHLHRRRPVRPRAAHGRRRQDLEPLRALGLVRRRASALADFVAPERTCA